MKEGFGSLLPKIITRVPGPKSTSLAQELVKHEPPGMTGISKGQVPIFWARAEGANVQDVDGNVFIDCTSAFGVSAVGHRNQYVISNIKKQADLLIHGMADVFPHEHRIQLARDIIRTVGRHEDSRVILVNTGSEAVEVAIKTAVLHTQRPGIISFRGGFHGQSIEALSVSSQRDFRDPFIGQITSNTVFVPFPNPYRPPFGVSSFDVSMVCLDHIDTILSSKVSGVPPIAAIIVEPIQGLNGCIVPPDDFLIGLREICDKHNILFIADEIFTGYGRTGAWLAVDHIQVIPDIICVGKAMTGGLPLAAVVADSSIMAAWESPGFVALHGSTFMANPLCCVAAIAAINQLENDSLIDGARSRGQYLREKLASLRSKYDIVGDVRGRGMAWAIELVQDQTSKMPFPKAASELVSLSLQRGVLFIITGYPRGNVVGIYPPLTISEKQLNYMMQVLDASINEVSMSGLTQLDEKGGLFL